MSKTSFLVHYDYGMGGVFAVINAMSREQITVKYPMLSIVEARPAWMTDDLYEKTRTNRNFDIDDPPIGWLLTVVQEASPKG